MRARVAVCAREAGRRCRLLRGETAAATTKPSEGGREPARVQVSKWVLSHTRLKRAADESAREGREASPWGPKTPAPTDPKVCCSLGSLCVLRLAVSVCVSRCRDLIVDTATACSRISGASWSRTRPRRVSWHASSRCLDRARARFGRSPRRWAFAPFSVDKPLSSSHRHSQQELATTSDGSHIPAAAAAAAAAGADGDRAVAAGRRRRAAAAAAVDGAADCDSDCGPDALAAGRGGVGG